jgi:hypothetical protein
MFNEIQGTVFCLQSAKWQKCACGKCMRTLLEYVFPFFLMTWKSDILFMRVIAKDIQGICKMYAQIKSGVLILIIVYMNNEKSFRFL